MFLYRHARLVRSGLVAVAMTVALLVTVATQLSAASDNSASVNLTPVIYANDRLYGTVIATNTDFSQAHPEESLDTIYTFPNQRSVADAAPGDPAFNGGRWAVRPVTWNVEPYPDDLTNAVQVLEATEAGDLSIGAPVRYFVCTLVPLR